MAAGANGNSAVQAITGEHDLPSMKDKYAEERDKRMRANGSSQFVDLYSLARFRSLEGDPWVDPTAVPGDVPRDGDSSQILIVGAGYSGLTFAARLLDAGFKLDDIRIIDRAGGFGGTWYWNRYPGLMCDIESYIYMPLLEETGYMPKHKYSYSTELREQAERVADKFKLNDRSWFCSTVTRLDWDESAADWKFEVIHKSPGDHKSTSMTVRSKFVIFACGQNSVPRIPTIPGMETFNGECFHTARWDYNCTGGSPDDIKMPKLKNKTVGIIGTGATAIQVVPALQTSCKELYVFQRTPSAVDTRDQRATDPEWWKREVTNTSGWQDRRRENFNAFLSNVDQKPDVNLVSDGWTTMSSYSVLVGNPDRPASQDPKVLNTYVDEVHTIDLARQERLRKRVDQVVKDSQVAESLKPWYAGWCKRPCFHDDYLKSFNEPNVTLVDNNGAGVDSITKTGVVIAGKEYKIDVLILSTGYRGPLAYGPGGRVDVPIRGRSGIELEEKWLSGVQTLHGVASHDFPNLFFPSLNQGGGSANYGHCMNVSAKHVAYILSQAVAKMSQEKQQSATRYKYNFTAEVTKEGEEMWTKQVVSSASLAGAFVGCTPSYFNAEGALDMIKDPEEQEKQAKALFWGKGFADYVIELKKWKAEGKLEGIEVRKDSM